MATQLIIPRQLDANGDSASGAKAYVYETGTTTPVTVYTNTGLSVAHASPIVADGAGYFAQAFYGGTTALKVVVTDSADATLVTYDPVPLVALSTSAASDIAFTPTTEIPQTDVQAAIVAVEADVSARADNFDNAAGLPTSTGSGGAYAITAANTVTAYATRQEFEFVANHASVGGGTDTLNVDGVGAVVLKKFSGTTTKADLAAGDIAVGDVVRVKHDGTHFVMANVDRGSLAGFDGSASGLSDFTSGSFTATCTPATSGTVTLGANTLYYERLGGKVHVWGRITVQSVSAPVGSLQIGTLPYAVRGNASSYNIYLAQSLVLGGTALTSHQCFSNWGQTTLTLPSSPTAQASDIFYINFAYHTDDAI